MIPSSLDNLSIARLDGLPPLHVNKKTKDSKAWKKAILDAFEYIGIQQIRENSTYIDRYRMINGQMSYQELSEVIPQLKGVEDLFNNADIPTFLKHYDLIGIIVKELVGKYMEILDKFHVVDLGEIAINDFLEFKNKEISETLNRLFENEINLELARKGIDPNREEFTSPEEQQQYIAMLQQERASIISPERLAQKQKSFKTDGVEWGETTLERDTEMLNLREKEKTEFRDYLLTGRCFREHKLYGNMYDSKTWSPLNTFVSKELDEKHAENLMYVGRVHTYTPQEVIREFHTKISADTARKILGDDKMWKNAFSDGIASGTINQAISNNFVEIDTVPFAGYHNYNYYLGLQDVLGVPLGEKTYINKDGASETVNSYLPKYQGRTFGGNTYLSKILRPDIIKPRTDMCQVTEVYFIAYDYVGYLTYENENGGIITELVTEDILEDFIREKGIKQSYKSVVVDQVDSFPVNTIQWFLTENTYYGIKIQSPYLSEPLYVECDLMDHQIKGASPFRRRLPVAGYLGKSPIEPAIPWQAKFNLALNQVWNLLEKEIGIFFLMDVKMIPDQYMGEDAEEAFGKLMDVAKSTGVFPVATTSENGGNNSPFNQMSTYNISYSSQINDRRATAEYCKFAAYEAIGIQQVMQQPTGYESATGVKIGQQVSFARVSEIFDDFGAYKKGLLDTHLAVAQYAQSNNMDQSIYWTKSDASIKFLQLSDPNKLPLRNIGVLPVDNARKRLELENLKNMLLQNNTAGADVLELSEIATSDHIQGLLEAARKGRQYREQSQQANFENQNQILDKERVYKKEESDLAWERKKYEIDTTNQTKIASASLMATGRAADNQATDAAFSQINQNTKDQTNLLKIEQDKIKHDDKMALGIQKEENAKTIAEEKLRLQAEALRLKEKQIKSNEYTSTINKN